MLALVSLSEVILGLFCRTQLLSEIDVLRVARRISLEFANGADVGGFLKMPLLLVCWRITADQS